MLPNRRAVHFDHGRKVYMYLRCDFLSHFRLKNVLVKLNGSSSLTVLPTADAAVRERGGARD